tara:strand:- start:3202 stop:3381 length:180 start_codon:yes stop_codon:yes gene_type:complete
MLELINILIAIFKIAPWVISGAALICSMTPTPKDDELIGKLYKILDTFALNIGKAKDKG